MKNKVIDLYRKMYLIRKVEDVIIENYYDDEMKTPMHMSRGSEAIAVGVSCELENRGQYFSTYRSHAPYFSSGGDINKFFAEMYGKKEGQYGGRAGSMHISSPETGHLSSSAIVASNIPVAVGAAWANKMQNNKKIVVVFFGDGATDEGSFWESINMSCLWKLPIIFVCEDNRLAVNTPSKIRQGYDNINDIVGGFNIISFCEKGIDPYAVSTITSKCIYHIDNYQKPIFLRLEYYRYLEHVGVNSDINESYRQMDAWNASENNDPIINFRKKVINLGVDVEHIESHISKLIYAALEYAKKGKFSDTTELYKDVFCG